MRRTLARNYFHRPPIRRRLSWFDWLWLLEFFRSRIELDGIRYDRHISLIAVFAGRRRTSRSRACRISHRRRFAAPALAAVRDHWFASLAGVAGFVFGGGAAAGFGRCHGAGSYRLPLQCGHVDTFQNCHQRRRKLATDPVPRQSTHQLCPIAIHRLWYLASLRSTNSQQTATVRLSAPFLPS